MPPRHDAEPGATATSADALAALLRRSPCPLLLELAGSRPVHLVGGVLRDAILELPARDLDCVVAGDGEELAVQLARRLEGTVVALGRDRFTAFRVVTPKLQIDLWDRGSTTLEADLRRRDFTIHSFALDIATGEITDPFRGLADLALGRLRMTTRDCFRDDPLRILRLCRLTAQLPGFTVDPESLAEAGGRVAGLRRVAAERLRSEVLLSLGCERVATAIDLWIRLAAVPDQLLERTIDGRQRRRLRARLRDSFRRLGATAARLPGALEPILTHLGLLLSLLEQQELGSVSQQATRLLESGLITKALGRRLRLLARLGEPPATAKEQRWWLHRLGPDWLHALAIAVAGASAARRPDLSERLQLALELVESEAEDIFDPPWLLSGEDLMAGLGLSPGPELGRLLVRVRRLQIENRVRPRQQALAMAANLSGRLEKA